MDSFEDFPSPEEFAKSMNGVEINPPSDDEYAGTKDAMDAAAKRHIRFVLLFALGLFLLCMICIPVQAQVDSSAIILRRLDSLMHTTDSLEKASEDLAHKIKQHQDEQRPVMRPSIWRKVNHPTRWYAGVLALGVSVNAVAHIDRDRGGYKDTWTTIDKWEHFTIGMFLVERADMIRVPLRLAVPITCATAVGWEFSQGYVSRKDIVATCGGAIMGAGFRKLVDAADSKTHFGW